MFGFPFVSSIAIAVMIAAVIGAGAFLAGIYHTGQRLGMAECAAAGDQALVEHLQATVAAQNDAIASGQQAVADARRKADDAHAKLRTMNAQSEDGQCQPGCTLSLPAQ